MFGIDSVELLMQIPHSEQIGQAAHGVVMIAQISIFGEKFIYLSLLGMLAHNLDRTCWVGSQFNGFGIIYTRLHA